MKNFENPNHDPVREFFNKNWKAFKKNANEALKQSEKGGYKENSIPFLKMVIGGELPPDADIGTYKKIVKEIVEETKQDDLEEKKKQEDLEDAVLQRQIKDSKDLQEEEENRTSIHPEDYKNKD